MYHSVPVSCFNAISVLAHDRTYVHEYCPYWRTHCLMIWFNNWSYSICDARPSISQFNWNGALIFPSEAAHSQSIRSSRLTRFVFCQQMSPSNQSILQLELKLQEDLAAFKKNVDNMFLITMGIFVFCKFWHFLNLIGLWRIFFYFLRFTRWICILWISVCPTQECHQRPVSQLRRFK